MKSISILGTTSDAGKSWLNTAFCALMRRKGIKVAPFKAQNMSNNSYVTLEGGEIGRAQAAQAEACGLRPIAEMNPVLLKPSGDSKSQVVLKGIPKEHIEASTYYKGINPLWKDVQEVLEWWKSQCDLLLLEGAGSPVELNLMQRDIVNLKPIEYLDGKWILACDIERGGVFAQAIGTINLMPKADQNRGLGIAINKFRGDPDLFKAAKEHFNNHLKTPYLGVIPMRYDLQPETEDGFSTKNLNTNHQEDEIAWISFPRVSNTQDCQPWSLDKGVNIRWVRDPMELRNAKAIVLPGTKNTIQDLMWLKDSGLEQAILNKNQSGIPILGICGGYQMLGETLEDPEGFAGRKGIMKGLGLLPIQTIFQPEKRVTQVEAHWNHQNWKAYEIHMGRSRATQKCSALLRIKELDSSEIREEGQQIGNVWGTYLHGFFENPETRTAFAHLAKISNHYATTQNWENYKQDIYSKMADHIEEHLDLGEVYRYVGI